MNQFVVFLCLLAYCSADFTSDCLNAHNSYRVEVDVPDLTWSEELANMAQSWANHLAQTGSLQYNQTQGVGENLAAGSSNFYTTQALIGIWGNQEKNFFDGIFPNVSTTGNWQDVGAYTQIVWRDTTQVGCGIATGFGFNYLVCEYEPAGNLLGEKVY